MVKKDLAMLRRYIGSLESLSIIKIASCYVDVTFGRMVSQKPHIFETIDDEQQQSYINFFKKGLSQKIGTTAFDLKPGQTNLLKDLWDDGLSDEKLVEEFFQKIYKEYVSDENYSIFVIFGAFDIPSKNKDCEQYRYILACLQPCVLSKPGIKYDSIANQYDGKSIERIIGDPLHTFLYPSLDDGHTEIDHAAYFAKNDKAVKAAIPLVSTVFDTEVPLSSEKQKKIFEEILTHPYDGKAPFALIQNVYDKLSDLVVDNALSGTDTTLTAEELGDIILESVEFDEKEKEELIEIVSAYKSCSLSVSNIVPEKISVKTGNASIKFDRVDIREIEKRMIDGKEYYLLPVVNSSVNDISV